MHVYMHMYADWEHTMCILHGMSTSVRVQLIGICMVVRTVQSMPRQFQTRVHPDSSLVSQLFGRHSVSNDDQASTYPSWHMVQASSDRGRQCDGAEASKCKHPVSKRPLPLQSPSHLLASNAVPPAGTLHGVKAARGCIRG